jgi:hypothetical protein
MIHLTSEKDGPLLNDISPKALSGAWFMAVGVVVGGALATGVKVDTGATALLLVLSLLPPTIAALVARRSLVLNPQKPAGRP